MSVYAVLRAVLRFVLRVFFRQIEVVGLEHLPPGGATIFAGNHQNSLLDPALLIAFTPRPVRVAAKDVLFASPLLRPVLLALGAVPVARRGNADGKVGEAERASQPARVDNAAAFALLAEILGGGGAMGIFPEGLSHDEAQLQRLKTGAARIALDVAAAQGVAVSIVPTGLVYVRPKRFRSRVLLQYGPPIVVDATRARAAGGEGHAAAVALTAELEQALRGLLVNAEDWDTVRVLDCVRRLYQPERLTLEQRAELMRRFNTHYLRVKDLPDVVALFARVRAYVERLERVGLSERDLALRLGPLDVALRVLRHAALTFVWMPLAIPGMVLFVPVLLGVRIVGPRFSPRRDVIATTKLVLGLFGSLGLVAAVGAIATAYAGPLAGALAVVAAFVSFHATLRVLERVTLIGRALPTLWRLLNLGDELDALRVEHHTLVALVHGAVERHRPAELRPMFAPAPLFDASDHLT
jgi:1-acyl-sn-glycerol-3-phosphate acyltransferase